MPNTTNITAPILVVGPGRSGSSWLVDVLAQHPDVQALIENTVIRAFYLEVFQSWWTPDWEWVCDEPERERRAVEAARSLLCKLFPSHQPRWVMKMIWGGQPWNFIRKVFPEARYIHITRSPTTAIPSIMEFVGKTDPAWNNLEFAEAQYLAANYEALQLREAGVPYLLVRQEEVLTEPERVWQQIRRFCRLSNVPFMNLTKRINAAKRESGSKVSCTPLPWTCFSKATLDLCHELGYLPYVRGRGETAGTVTENLGQTGNLLNDERRLKMANSKLTAENDNSERQLPDDGTHIGRTAQTECEAAMAGYSRISKVVLVGEDGLPRNAFDVNQTVVLKITVTTDEPVSNPGISFFVQDEEGRQLFGTTTFDERVHLPGLAAGESLEVTFRFTQSLRVGQYTVGVAFYDLSSGEGEDNLPHHEILEACTFRARGSPARPIRYVFNNPVSIQFAKV